MSSAAIVQKLWDDCNVLCADLSSWDLFVTWFFDSETKMGYNGSRSHKEGTTWSSAIAWSSPRTRKEPMERSKESRSKISSFCPYTA